jgi:aryl-alcohol dehydrogenase-like predicted oxidoreductase
LLAGHATQAGTSKFAERAVGKMGVNGGHFRESCGLRLSSLGIGTYLGGMDAETDRLVEEAVLESVSSGAVNVIDTAINYRLQRAERSVGRALARLGDEGVEGGREALFVCTKNGYLSSDGELSIDFRSYIQNELIKPGKLKPEEIAGEAHSMAVPFLKDQLRRSLANLGLECVDVLYLHNAAESWLAELGYRRFIEKLWEVFTLYEEERKSGRILYYGMATWSCFRVKEGEAEHLNLDDVVDVAKGVGGEEEHGFRFLQLPFNIAMSEALTQRNQRIADEPLTTFEASKRLGVGVFTSVPLSQGRLLSHTRVPALEGSRALSLIQFARSAHPAVVAPLIGQKSPEHTRENLRIAMTPPLTEPEFRETYKGLI